MTRLSLPWASRPALTGAALGVAADLLVSFGLHPSAPVGLVLALALPGCGWLAGVAVASRRRFREATRDLVRLRQELRATQDHLMEHGSARSLPVYLEAAAATLREPLASLPKQAGGLASDPALPETARPAAARVAERIGALAEALKPLASYSPATPSRAPFNLNNLLREAIALCRHRAEEKQIRFEERYKDVPPVFGPAGRTATALLNVIVNAIEAMPFSGGIIVVQTAHEGDRAVARVRDSGIGIRPEHLGKVFDPFFSTKPDKGSAGLGLWETRDTLDRLGATITINSVPHQGTEVVMSFPQAAPLHPGREGTVHPQELPRNTADRAVTA